jgi:hypothetical protein
VSQLFVESGKRFEARALPMDAPDFLRRLILALAQKVEYPNDLDPAPRPIREPAKRICSGFNPKASDAI